MNHPSTIKTLGRSLCWCVIAFVIVICATVDALGEDFPQPPDTETASDLPRPPEEICKSAILPPGFQLSVFAAEPDVRNPIAITTDDRGRLWVAENYTWAGADAGNFDLRLRDRVVILEDTDGDGKHDNRTVFWDQPTRLTSIEVGFGGVWLLCSPELLFVPDKNHDDVPDGPPQVVLDGFDIKTVSHNAANGLKWGPDGWLYGRQGILGTSKIGIPQADEATRVKINTGVWRYHPTRHVCQAIMHGMTNPWGFDYDAYGEMFVINTVIGHLWHVIPGARTERMFGTDFNPHAYQLISQVADHVHWSTDESWVDVRKGVTDRTIAAGGGHAHTGLMIYQGNNWPVEYRDRVFMLNLHGRRINCDLLTPTAVDYTAAHGRDMCFIADPWFRGMDLIAGADGAAFIADWSDTGECHEIGGVHRSSGRIYRLTFGKATAPGPIDLAENTDTELAEMQAQQNDWFTRHARRVLQERADAGILDSAAVREMLLKIFQKDSDPVHRVRAMWALYLTHSVDNDWLKSQLRHPDEHVRVWTVRMLVDSCTSQGSDAWAPLLDNFRSVAEQDQSGHVLLYVASALQQMPNAMRWTIGRILAGRSESEFTGNRTLAIMLWLGIEPLVTQNPAQSIALLRETTFPLLRENISRRFTLDIDRDISSVEQLLSLAANDPQHAVDILRGMNAALNGWKNPSVPSNWEQASSAMMAAADLETRDHIQAIGVAFKDQHIIDTLLRTTEDVNSPPDARRRALQLLLIARPQDMNLLLHRLMKDKDLALEAIQGLAQFDDTEAASSIVETFGSLSPALRAAAINTLASRPSYARLLVQALAAKQIAPSDISAFHVRQMTALNDNVVSDKLRELWGEVRDTPEDKRGAIVNLKKVLTEQQLAEAKRENGKAIFARTCASCHILFGEGGKIGPELTGSNRKNLDYLLQNIMDPSAIVGADFRVSTFFLADGRILNGIIREQNDRTITIDTPQGRQTFDRQDVDEIHASNLSLMPDGLLQGLTGSQICDLVAYLMSN